jgi:hypothetical protein
MGKGGGKKPERDRRERDTREKEGSGKGGSSLIDVITV